LACATCAHGSGAGVRNCPNAVAAKLLVAGLPSKKHPPMRNIAQTLQNITAAKKKKLNMTSIQNNINNKKDCTM
jgi:hypothetical protein